MHNALNSSRSIQTIRDCTNIVASVPLRHWDDSLQIREMGTPGELKDQRFIITLKSDVEAGSFTIKLFAELMVLNNRLRFLVKPEKQFQKSFTAKGKFFGYRVKLLLLLGQVQCRC